MNEQSSRDEGLNVDSGTPFVLFGSSGRLSFVPREADFSCRINDLDHRVGLSRHGL